MILPLFAIVAVQAPVEKLMAADVVVPRVTFLCSDFDDSQSDNHLRTIIVRRDAENNSARYLRVAHAGADIELEVKGAIREVRFGNIDGQDRWRISAVLETTVHRVKFNLLYFPHADVQSRASVDGTEDGAPFRQKCMQIPNPHPEV